MMYRNIVYIFFPKGAGHYTNDMTVLEVCLSSLRRHNRTCVVKLFYTDVSDQEIKSLSDKYDIEAFQIKEEIAAREINKRKIMAIAELDLEDGDNLLVCDIDLFFRKDPFAIFEKDFDVFATSRGYKYSQSIDTGIWGLKYNERSKAFLQFYIEQAKEANWPPLRKWADHYHSPGHWWFDQDFLCVVFMINWLKAKGHVAAPWLEVEELRKFMQEAELPFEIKLYDATFAYAYTTWVSKKHMRQNLLDLFEKIYFGDIPVIHLRAAMHRNHNLKELGLIERNHVRWFLRWCYCGFRRMWRRLQVIGVRSEVRGER